MTSNAFLVTDLTDLRVLQRVFREAKFCPIPDDLEISDSPWVARLFCQLMDALIAADVAKNGEEQRERWNKCQDGQRRQGRMGGSSKSREGQSALVTNDTGNPHGIRHNLDEPVCPDGGENGIVYQGSEFGH